MEYQRESSTSIFDISIGPYVKNYVYEGEVKKDFFEEDPMVKKLGDCLTKKDIIKGVLSFNMKKEEQQELIQDLTEFIGVSSLGSELDTGVKTDDLGYYHVSQTFVIEEDFNLCLFETLTFHQI